MLEVRVVKNGISFTNFQKTHKLLQLGTLHSALAVHVFKLVFQCDDCVC
jgi:hypothetical protein